jgi:hypothetical protein
MGSNNNKTLYESEDLTIEVLNLRTRPKEDCVARGVKRIICKKCGAKVEHGRYEHARDVHGAKLSKASFYHYHTREYFSEDNTK